MSRKSARRSEAVQQRMIADSLDNPEAVQRMLDDQVARGWVRVVGYANGETQYQITEEGHRQAQITEDEQRRARRSP